MSDLKAYREGADLLEQLWSHAATFVDCHGPGDSPRLFFSPGRVNLFGGHLDYNGGPVMPTAIDRGTFMAVRHRSDRVLRIASTYDRRGVQVDLTHLPDARVGRWVDYPLGVVADFVSMARQSGRERDLGGLEILYGGDLPIGAGLSSSASMCVGTALMLDCLWGLGLSPLERVQSALRAEREFVGVQCGIMDPYAIGCARPDSLLWIDCKDESIEYIPVDYGSLSILVTNTGVQRQLAAGEFNLRVEQCGQAFAALRPHWPDAQCLCDIPLDVLEAEGAALDPVIRNRAEHVLRETARTYLAREALLANDPARMGDLMTQTHESLRDLYDVSCPELDTLVDAVRECPSAYGARLTGAGFGGCTVTLARHGSEPQVRAALEEHFHGRFGRRPQVEVFGGDQGPRELHAS